MLQIIKLNSCLITKVKQAYCPNIKYTLEKYTALFFSLRKKNIFQFAFLLAIMGKKSFYATKHSFVWFICCCVYSLCCVCVCWYYRRYIIYTYMYICVCIGITEDIYIYTYYICALYTCVAGLKVIITSKGFIKKFFLAIPAAYKSS